MLGPWVAIVAFLVAIANTVWVWMSQPGQLAKKQNEELNDDLKAHDRRIQSLESDSRHLPTKEDFHKLVEQFARMQARMETEMESMGHTVRRLDNYLRSEK